MKTRKELGPADVPPGSFLRRANCKPTSYVPCWVDDHDVWTPEEMLSYEELMEDGWQILRPGESWQPCCKEVEEFNPADYKPGQIVDVQTARKLQAFGVKLQYILGLNCPWTDLLIKLVDSDTDYQNPNARIRVSLPPGELTAGEAKAAFDRGENVQCKLSQHGEWKNLDDLTLIVWNQYAYRLKPAPRVRDMRPDELPTEFLLRHDNNCMRLVKNYGLTNMEIPYWKSLKGEWSRSLDGPWNDFTVEEKE